MTLTCKSTLAAAALCLSCGAAHADTLKPKRRPAPQFEQAGNPAVPGRPGTSPGFYYRSDPRLNPAGFQPSPYPQTALPVRAVPATGRNPAPSIRNPASVTGSAHGSGSSRNNVNRGRGSTEPREQTPAPKVRSAGHKTEDTARATKPTGQPVSGQAAALPGKVTAPPAPARANDDAKSATENSQPERTVVVPTRNPAEIQRAFSNQLPASGPATMPPESVPGTNIPRSQSIAAPPLSRMPRSDQNLALESLSENERAKLHSAHEAALSDPNVLATRSRYLEARKQYRDQLRNALLKADPGIEPILDKVKKTTPDQH